MRGIASDILCRIYRARSDTGYDKSSNMSGFKGLWLGKTNHLGVLSLVPPNNFIRRLI